MTNINLINDKQVGLAFMGKHELSKIYLNNNKPFEYLLLFDYHIHKYDIQLRSDPDQQYFPKIEFFSKSTIHRVYDDLVMPVYKRQDEDRYLANEKHLYKKYGIKFYMATIHRS